MRSHVARKSRFTEEQIAFALKQIEVGTRVEEVSQDGHHARKRELATDLMQRFGAMRKAAPRFNSSA
jgi:hypothetical protein